MMRIVMHNDLYVYDDVNKKNKISLFLHRPPSDNKYPAIPTINTPIFEQ